jgi:hypothetical protein
VSAVAVVFFAFDVESFAAAFASALADASLLLLPSLLMVVFPSFRASLLLLTFLLFQTSLLLLTSLLLAYLLLLASLLFQHSFCSWCFQFRFTDYDVPAVGCLLMFQLSLVLLSVLLLLFFFLSLFYPWGPCSGYSLCCCRRPKCCLSFLLLFLAHTQRAFQVFFAHTQYALNVLAHTQCEKFFQCMLSQK